MLGGWEKGKKRFHSIRSLGKSIARDRNQNKRVTPCGRGSHYLRIANPVTNFID